MSTTDPDIIGWDDEIANDGQGGYEVFPEGIYPCEIVDCQRKVHTPKHGGKLPPCPKAEVTVRVYRDGPHDYTDVRHNLFLHRSCEGMLCQFFKGLGHRKHGEPLRPDWSKVVGARGTVKLVVREWAGDDGVKRQQNDIKAWLDPAKVAPPVVDEGF